MFNIRSGFVSYDVEGSHARSNFIPLGCFVSTYLRGTGEPTPAKNNSYVAVTMMNRPSLPKSLPWLTHIVLIRQRWQWVKFLQVETNRPKFRTGAAIPLWGTKCTKKTETLSAWISIKVVQSHISKIYNRNLQVFPLDGVKCKSHNSSTLD